jgi:hypothetical protein
MKPGILGALCCACGVLFSSAVCADNPRLNLRITQAISGQADVSSCRLPKRNAPAPTSLLLTERDVLAWEPNTGSWQLDTHRFPNAAAGWRLADHCFELVVDGKRISSGVVLWKHSARLTRIPT